MPTKLRDHTYDDLIKRLRTVKQQGKGFIGEGTCNASNYAFGYIDFFIPMTSEPDSVNLTNADYTNCSNLVVAYKDKNGFVARVTVTSDGSAWCFFNWETIFT